MIEGIEAYFQKENRRTEVLEASLRVVLTNDFIEGVSKNGMARAYRLEETMFSQITGYKNHVERSL